MTMYATNGAKRPSSRGARPTAPPTKPLVNTGVKQADGKRVRLHDDDQQPALTLRSGPTFDWYSASLDVDAWDAAESLAVDLRADVEPGKPRQGYARGHQLVRHGEIVAGVLEGGYNRNPHAWASGKHTTEFVEAVRARYSDNHRVARVDSFFDFGGMGDGDETWDALYDAVVRFAKDRPYPVKTALSGDFHDKMGGRTMYLGSRKSKAYVRLYEKGKQTRNGLTKRQREAIPTDWVRLEVEVKPKGVGRVAAATWTPAEVWGIAAWSKDLAAMVAALDVERASIPAASPSSDDRKFSWLVQQYGKTLRRMADQNGWEAVAARLKSEVWDE